MEELKPCPFCGNKAEKRFNFSDEYFKVSISCTKCNTCKKNNTYLERKYFFENPYRKFIEAEEEVVKAWNQRANDGMD